MDSTIIKLEPGKISLTIDFEHLDHKPVIIAVADIPADGRDRIYYQRQVLNESRVIVNLPFHPDQVKVVTFNAKIKTILQGKLKPVNIPYLDKPTDKRPYSIDEIKIIKDYTISSPASTYKDKPIIRYNPDKMRHYTEPSKKFIMYHELGHNFFNDEEKADRFATIVLLNQGFNISSAIYALTTVLGRSKENVIRSFNQNELLKKISNQYYG